MDVPEEEEEGEEVEEEEKEQEERVRQELILDGKGVKAVMNACVFPTSALPESCTCRGQECFTRTTGLS